ncbi:hypothetical protein [Thiomicrorhabdus sp. 6S3-12]|uniref:hypothetical protein n=1 Tax=Thiomicrorhabdus sp. 6S3-12 TaxID=2819681 RepID=UPI001AADAB03|nr:hypothetical protein [Thiomicrorhabdus sp. 6S3-12]MBO1923608.1 hypothetical protein [Thiomicrorhabdus sp. 6S3-12]
MSVKFSAALFQQLGVAHWTARDSVFHASPEVMHAMGSPVSEDHEGSGESDVSNSESHPEPKMNKASELKASQASKLKEVAPLRQVALVGQGLQSLWQDESKAEWQLWSQIMLAMGWSEEEILFVDTSLLISEEQVYSSVEEIIDSGVDCLLSMDPEHVINEVLSEGSEVLPVPDFDLMLSDPHAKKSFYQQALRLDAQLR